MTQGTPGFFVPSKIAGLHYEMRPNFSGRVFGCEVKINSQGLRSPERPAEKPEGVRRVLVLGDSVAFGHGVEQSAAFPAVLEKLLNEKDRGTTIEVINAAVPGYNSEQEYVYLREKGFALRPDVVLVAAVVNDVEPAYDVDENGALRWKDPPEIYREAMEQLLARRGLRGFLARHIRLFTLFDNLFHPPYFLTRRYLDYLDRIYAPESPGWLSARDSLVAIRVMCKARGVGFLLAFCPIPAKHEPETLRRIRERFAKLAESEGIDFVDLYDAQSRWPTDRLILSKYDRHPSVFGHSVIAKALAPLVARELADARPIAPLPERKGKPAGTRPSGKTK